MRSLIVCALFVLAVYASIGDLSDGKESDTHNPNLCICPGYETKESDGKEGQVVRAKRHYGCCGYSNWHRHGPWMGPIPGSPPPYPPHPGHHGHHGWGWGCCGK